MNEKFTKGEWEFVGHQVVLKELPDHKRCHGYGCDDRFICDLDDGEYHEYWDDKELEANGYLIAAAPKLYKLLKLACHELEIVANFCEENGMARDALSYNNLVIGLHGALAEARGEHIYCRACKGTGYIKSCCDKPDKPCPNCGGIGKEQGE